MRFIGLYCSNLRIEIISTSIKHLFKYLKFEVYLEMFRRNFSTQINLMLFMKFYIKKIREKQISVNFNKVGYNTESNTEWTNQITAPKAEMHASYVGLHFGIRLSLSIISSTTTGHLSYNLPKYLSLAS